MTIATERLDIATGSEHARLTQAALVAAERFGSPAHLWLHAVAALHAVAQFFADAAILPVPESTTVHCRVDTLAELELVAEHFGVKIYGDQPQCHVEILSGHDGPLFAQVIIAVRREDRPL